MIPDLTTAPWKKVGTNLFHCKGKDCLLVIIIVQNSLKLHCSQMQISEKWTTNIKTVGSHGSPDLEYLT